MAEPLNRPQAGRPGSSSAPGTSGGGAPGDATPGRPSIWRGIDPRDVPIAQRYGHLPAVPGERLDPAWIRGRLAAPPAWDPEHTGDASRQAGRSLRPAAVLMPIVLHASEPTVLLTQRPTHMREHAGQVAFPGGRSDEADGGPVDTALREAWEEIGLPREHVEIIGLMPAYCTGTGYEVTPVVGLVRPGFSLRIHQGEVAEAFEVPLHFLMNPRHHERRHLRREDIERDFLAMPYRRDQREFFIWGATAAMLRNFYRLLMA